MGKFQVKWELKDGQKVLGTELYDSVKQAQKEKIPQLITDEDVNKRSITVFSVEEISPG